MKLSPQVISKLTTAPWAILPASAVAWASTFRFEAPQVRGDGDTNFFGDSVPKMQVCNGVAIIPVSGPLIFGAGFLEKGYGAVAHADIEDDIEQAEGDDSIKAICFAINSPGGTVSGTPELAARIAAIQKPTAAFTDELCASAAYWIACACDAVYSTSSAQVGSIGTILSLMNFADALAEAGIEVNILQSGSLKSAGSPYKGLSNDERAHFQNMVDSLGAEFRSNVSSHRPQIEDDSMQGQTFWGSESLARGLVDAIVPNMNAVISKISMQTTFKKSSYSGTRAKISGNSTAQTALAAMIKSGSKSGWQFDAIAKVRTLLPSPEQVEILGKFAACIMVDSPFLGIDARAVAQFANQIGMSEHVHNLDAEIKAEVAAEIAEAEALHLPMRAASNLCRLAAFKTTASAWHEEFHGSGAYACVKKIMPLLKASPFPAGAGMGEKIFHLRTLIGKIAPTAEAVASETTPLGFASDDELRQRFNADASLRHEFGGSFP